MSAAKIKVLCVDDSALIRDLLTEIINSQPDMEVVAVAPDPIAARDLIKQHNPDVLTLDVEMPRMDGLDFLERLMRLRPMPVLMVSSLTQSGSEITLRALELGALDFVAKPSLGIRSGMMDYANEIAEKLRAAARSRPRQARHKNTPPPAQLKAPMVSSEKLIIIGASTGGTEAIRAVLEPLPANAPAILITQHMPGALPARLPSDWTVCAVLPSRKPPTVSVCCPGMPILPRETSTLRSRAAGPTMWRVSTTGHPSTATALRWTYCFIPLPTRPVKTPSA